ncbi:MAG: methyltransferase domain-containing protein [Candidatus Hydrogenedentes bacterium]|nr:methyltransferase domain-containing protein [Candidatus Hydrogenedentota bacterium]
MDEPYLNFGAGNPVAGWVNLDASPFFRLPRWMHRCLGAARLDRSKHFAQGAYRHYRHACGKRLPFPDASFRAIYASHVLEHVPADALDGLFAEFHRILEPEGLLRVVVPDLRTNLITALEEEQGWVSLDRALHITALMGAPRIIRALEGWAGFPSMHRVVFLPESLENGLGGGWRVRTGLSFLESDIDAERLRAVEQERRCENAVIFDARKVIG